MTQEHDERYLGTLSEPPRATSLCGRPGELCGPLFGKVSTNNSSVWRVCARFGPFGWKEGFTCLLCGRQRPGNGAYIYQKENSSIDSLVTPKYMNTKISCFANDPSAVIKELAVLSGTVQRCLCSSIAAEVPFLRVSCDLQKTRHYCGNERMS